MWPKNRHQNQTANLPHTWAGKHRQVAKAARKQTYKHTISFVLFKLWSIGCAGCSVFGSILVDGFI